MTAFFLMYRMNNEYTARGEEPIQGILCLDEEKAAGKLHCLAREWQYFPGKLLTPDMLKENTGYYSRYISIGEYGGMELCDKNASPYGCGTYPMILILPKKEQTWALSLKKVFSAYRIYINGELLSESYGKEAIKDPGPGSDQYAERIAGTWERICHGILYLRHVWSAYSTYPHQDISVSYD